jgi:alkyl hydroperoxide reductase subunit AhpF
LAALKRPVHIEVFVTLDCAHCPKAVETAHRLALESDRVTADMVEVSAFRDLASAHEVRSVPKVLVNGLPCFEGGRPEEAFVSAVVQAVSEE